MKAEVFIIHPGDNTGIALRDLKEDEEVRLSDGRTLKVLTDVMYGHKVALENIAKGAAILKYGEVIGGAKDDIRQGSWVHSHNLDTRDQKG